MRESSGMRGSHPTCKTMNTQYDAFFKREENCATPSRYALFRRISRSFLLFFIHVQFCFLLHLCAKGSVCYVRGVAYYNRCLSFTFGRNA